MDDLGAASATAFSLYILLPWERRLGRHFPPFRRACTHVPKQFDCLFLVGDSSWSNVIDVGYNGFEVPDDCCS